MSIPGGIRVKLSLALLVIVVGSLAGQWLSVQNKMSDRVSFYFGHQGYEYVDLGRAWQIGLMVGLLLWLFLMIRVLLPALRQRGVEVGQGLGDEGDAVVALCGQRVEFGTGDHGGGPPSPRARVGPAGPVPR